MRAILIPIVVAGLVANVTRSECAIRGPVIAPSRGGFVLLLPPEMAAAVQRAVPGLQTETLLSYHADVQKYYPFTSRQAPWAVVGDFDGDGGQDVVLDGHAGDKCYRLCVWGRARPEVDTLSVRACADRAGGEGSISVLMYVPPGKRHTNFSDDFVFIFTDAYDDYGWEKAGSTWYWKDGRWNEFFSSD